MIRKANDESIGLETSSIGLFRYIFNFKKEICLDHFPVILKNNVFSAGLPGNYQRFLLIYTSCSLDNKTSIIVGLFNYIPKSRVVDTF